MGLIRRFSLHRLLRFVLPLHAQQRFITVASTTSTEQSGLFKHLLPIFEKKTGIQVRVVALGTGQALDMGRRGDADVVFVHAKPLEEKFVAEGFGVKRHEVMYNDFVLVGPQVRSGEGRRRQGHRRGAAEDHGRRRRRSPRAATRAARTSPSSSCGRRPASTSRKEKGPWYRETGSGMGPTLNTASGMNAYALTDRGTWLSFKNRGELAIVVEGDKRLFNQYGVMLVNPAKHPHVKKDMGQAFIDWLVSPEGQKAIADYKIGGEQLFLPERGRCMARYRGLTLRVLGQPRPAMGPGKAELIERIARPGSISAAARAMGMSYRRAWQLVEALNKDLPGARGATAAGGARGGGARVTPFGRRLVAEFRAMEDKASAAIAGDLKRFQRYIP